MESEAFCHSHGWLFTAMGFNCWGGTGPRASAFLRKLDKAIAGDPQGWSRRQVIRRYRQRIVFHLMSYVAQQLLPIDDAFTLEMSTGEEWRDMPPQGSAVPLLAVHEVDAWESEEEEEPLTALRVTRRKPQ